MELIAGEGAAYGYRKLTVRLRKLHHLVINKKKVYRLCKQMNVLRPQRKLKVKHPRRLANNRVITGANQLWETDIKYGWIAGEGRFFFIMCLLDVFDRSIITYHVGLSCESKHLVQITQEALMKRQLFDKKEKPVVRSDNGPQFINIYLKKLAIPSVLSMNEYHLEHPTRMLISNLSTPYWNRNVIVVTSLSLIQRHT